MQFPLVFMVLPIALHKTTREALPAGGRTSLPGWLLENGEARINFAERVISLKPHTREAVSFGLASGVLHIEGGAIARTADGKRLANRALNLFEGEARECLLAARVIGKWFASIDSPETTMALWGIQP
ncbi:MAG: hypothetical protein HY255_02360 [Betaproteobacteria bacterium]|nr:hypothetical protein [Betaproteobacteria bacterium]